MKVAPSLLLLAASLGLLLSLRTSDEVEAVVPGTNGKIAFESDRDGNSEVYVMNADGSSQTNLTKNPAIDGQPAWSPDGSKIAFHSDRDGNFEIYVMNANGTGVKRLTNHTAEDASPAWSPDGTKIAFDSLRNGNYEIMVMNADGTGVKNLTNHPATDTFPTFSPDGRTIAFESVRDGDFDIYVMNIDGSNVRNVSQASPVQDFHAAWSPDGSSLIFNTFQIAAGNEYLDVAQINVGGDGLRPITAADKYWEHGPTWSPDGTTVAMAVSPTKDGNYDIWLSNLGGVIKKLTNSAGRDAYPDWQPLPPVMCTVATVIDGDTFTCSDGKTVDMLQIDAQELGQCGGGWAKAALENIFLTPGRVVRLDFDRTQSAGGATLASPVARGTDGADYNISIVMAFVGLAKSATIGANNTWFLDWANASQAWAQAAQWNMWAPGKTYTGGCD